MKKRRLIPPIIGVLIIVVIVIIGSSTPLIALLNPDSGIIQNSRNLVIGNETISMPGLSAPVTVIQDNSGVYHFYASNTNDLYYSLGFVQAKNRLFQIETFGLEGMGQMSSFFGNSYLNYDHFQTMTGAPLTAVHDWEKIQNSSSSNTTDALTVSALTSYTKGINAYINYSEEQNTLPLMYKLLGVLPYQWTPVYTFAVQELMTQTLEFGAAGLQYAIIHSLAGNETGKLIPEFSPVQSYYYAGYSGPPNHNVLSISNDTYSINSTVRDMANTLLYQFRYDPPTYFPAPMPDHSNEWVVAGNRTATGNPMLTGGPVLGFSLPAIWFQVQLVAPGLDVYGVVLPGAPVVVIGFNSNIAWTLTDTQSISDGTFFFVQNVSGDSYYWNSSLHRMNTYESNGMQVNWTNLGPIMERNGTTAIVMDWMGNGFSNDMGALLNIMNSSNWNDFRNALSIWKAPFQNFAFANRTMIADISPANYPIFGGHVYNPSSIMPGNGTEYISSYFPYSMVPQVVNPKQGFIVSSNQRQIGPAFPYWYGNTMTFSPGYRSFMEVNYLSTHTNVTASDLISFQQKNYTDYEAQVAVPYILSDIAGSTNSTMKEVYSLLSGWNYSMTTGSKAASVWFFTYMYLFNNTFLPYLHRIGWLPGYENTLGVPSGMSGSFPGTTGYASMDVDLLQIITNSSARPFINSSLTHLIEESAMQAMNYLNSRYPGGNYTWGHFYGFMFPNLYGLSSFSVGPKEKGGDFNTPNDASGVGPSNYPTGGQSWVMLVNMTNVSRSYGIFPGGQSGNPESPLYSNYINDWINGTYLPLIYIKSHSSFPGDRIMDITVLKPGGGP